MSVCHVCSAHLCLRVFSYTSGLISVSPSHQQPIHSLDEFATYNQDFRRITGRLAREGRANPDELRKAYTKSIHRTLCRKIEIYLNMEKIVPPIIGEPCLIEHVRVAAEYILKGLDPRFDNVVVVHQLEPSKALPAPPPPMKSENAEPLNTINMLGQNFQAALKSVTHPVQQNFPSGYFPSGPANFPRQDRPRPGSAGNKCFICHNISHFINQCNILSQYTANGKLARGPNPANPANPPPVESEHAADTPPPTANMNGIGNGRECSRSRSWGDTNVMNENELPDIPFV